MLGLEACQRRFELKSSPVPGSTLFDRPSSNGGAILCTGSRKRPPQLDECMLELGAEGLRSEANYLHRSVQFGVNNIYCSSFLGGDEHNEMATTKWPPTWIDANSTHQKRRWVYLISRVMARYSERNIWADLKVPHTHAQRFHPPARLFYFNQRRSPLQAHVLDAILTS